MADTARLDDYLDLIERERESRPAEAMLADEIVRLRAKERASTVIQSSHLTVGDAFAMVALIGFIFGWVLMWSFSIHYADAHGDAVSQMSTGTALVILAGVFLPCLWAGELVGHIVRRGIR